MAKEKTDWFETWFEDKKSMLATMYKNMVADLEAGYSPIGQAIRKQVAEIELYKMEFDQAMEMFKYMDDAQVQRWCYYDMKKRGVIT